MKKTKSQKIDLKGAGFCQINGDNLIIKGKDLKCKEKGNIFYIQNSNNSYSNNSLTITGNGNIIGLIGCNVGTISQTIIVENGDVFVNNTSIKNNTTDLEVLEYKLTNSIKELKISGAGDFIVDTDMFDKDEVEITLKGSGNFNINNIKSKNVYIDLIGSGDIEVGHIEADNLIVELKGSGDIEIHYAKAKNLDVKLLGSGDIEINGDFENISKTKIGSGDLKII